LRFLAKAGDTTINVVAAIKPIMTRVAALHTRFLAFLPRKSFFTVVSFKGEYSKTYQWTDVYK